MSTPPNIFDIETRLKQAEATCEAHAATIEALVARIAVLENITVDQPSGGGALTVSGGTALLHINKLAP